MHSIVKLLRTNPYSRYKEKLEQISNNVIQFIKIFIKQNFKTTV